MLQVQLLAQERDQDVNAHGDPCLGLHRVLGIAEKRFDVEMLLDPFEEKFDLPPRLVEGGDDMRRQYEIVGDEDQCLLGFHVAESDAAQSFRVGRCRFHSVGHDDPIRSHAGGLVDRLRLDATQQQRRFWASDKECAGLMKAVKPFQVLISTIHDVVRAWLWSEYIQGVNIMDFAVCYVDKCRDGATQVDQRMQLHGGFGPTKLGPREQLKTEINGRRIESVNRLRQVSDCRILGIQISRLGDQHLGKVCEDAPVPLLVRIGQSRAGNGTTNSQVVELGRHRTEARLNVPQTLPTGQLSKGHAQELVHVGEGSRGTSIRISRCA